MKDKEIQMMIDFLEFLRDKKKGWFWEKNPNKAVEYDLCSLDMRDSVMHEDYFRASTPTGNFSYKNFSKTKPHLPLKVTVNNCGECHCYPKDVKVSHYGKCLLDADLLIKDLSIINTSCPLRRENE